MVISKHEKKVSIVINVKKKKKKKQRHNINKGNVNRCSLRNG